MKQDSIARPQPAATVMLVRDADQGMEVFMIVRHAASDVHGGALVFPGGRVDPEDYEIAAEASLFPQAGELDQGSAALRVAAVRETFEECGVLLARARGEASLVSAERLRAIDAQHGAAMLCGELTFGAMLRLENLVLAAEQLVYFAHWITPERSRLRFDTHFFVAQAPAHQLARHDGREAVDSVWIRPPSALEQAQAGVYQLRFPTQMNLQKLGRHTGAAPAIASARAARVVTVMTKQERSAGGIRVLRIPLEADYGGELFEVRDTPGNDR
jgi:8-oxo-dGTP pyrophosphatase MutT (NUDIX family)